MRSAVTVLVVGWLLALTVYDLRRHRLPNALTLPGAAAVLCGAALAGHGRPALAGAVALAVVYLLVHLRSPEAMGAGDVKLAVGLGAWTGAFGVEAWTLAAVGAPLVTVLAGMLGRRRVLPHGPSMCAASVTAVVLAG